MELLFELVLEGISLLFEGIKAHPVLKVIIVITAMLAAAALLIWLMVALGIWK